jgi:hypothetical protein
MVSKKLNFTEFYDLLLEVRDDEDDTIRVRYKRHLYENYRYWSMKALNDYIRNTELEEDNDKRQDKSVISKIAENRGVTLASFMELVCNANANHHSLLEEVRTIYNVDKQLIIDCNKELIDRAIEELIDEYNINMVGAYEGW